MSSYSQITLLGRLGKDPVTNNQGQSPYTTFTLAVDQGWGDKKTTGWYSVICFGKQSEVAAKYLKKGSQVLISGTPEIKTFTGRDGIEKTTISVAVNQLTLVGKGQASTPTPTGQPNQPVDDDILVDVPW